MVSPQKENSGPQKLPKELCKRVSGDMRHESAAKVYPPDITRSPRKRCAVKVSDKNRDVPVKAKTLVVKAPRKEFIL